MHYRTLGKTGLSVSAIIYGGIISTDETQRDSDRYVAESIERGINYYDVAPMYGNAQERLGISLKPYRKDVYLACKTFLRDRNEAEDDFRESLRLLNTDYFDVYQLHSMTTADDVERVFAPGGLMDFLVRQKEAGVIRHIGFSAHSEEAALMCMERYDFETVLFPLNYHIDLKYGFGRTLMQQKKDKGFGVLALKPIIDRAWKTESERQTSVYPKSWCKPFAPNETELAVAAMRYALAMGGDVLVPPGNQESYFFMLDQLETVLKRPLSADDVTLLKAHYETVKDHPFFAETADGWETVGLSKRLD